ncbi:RDD family protein [Nocardioides sp.]|uniref:RDD family protein n=1 Tax=Nocardioides sp. TaxID=35761 RepID=UPI002D7F7713|nr:RDD family protein [Nocardioides sp.]HET8961231.1 RDD family protein [Nocardioides sp.]
MTQPADEATIVATGASVLPAADLDRRFYAFVLDRLIGWSVAGLAAWATYGLLFSSGGPGAAVLVALGTLLVVGLAMALVAGLRGTSPGMAVLGLRLVHVDSGEPIGVLAAIRRALILGMATLPTFGLGVATLAWTSVMDPGRRRRGWHDLVTGSVVVDVRPAPEVPAVAAQPTRQIVNLTAARLAPPVAQSPIAQSPVAQSPLPDLPVATGASGPPLARWRLAFDSGETLVVEGLVVVGRRPEPPPGEEARHVVPLRSEDMSLSKTHAQLQVAPDGVLVVMDRGSTNGSVLIRQGVPKDLVAGKPTTLLPGDEVAFGDRRMTVDREP